MNICLISSGYIQNDPRYYFLANSFKNAGHEVTLINIRLTEHQQQLSQEYKIVRDYPILDISFQQYIHSTFSTKFPDFFACYTYELIPHFINSYIQMHGEKFLQVDLFYGLEMFCGGVIAQQLAKKTNKEFIVDFKELFSEMSTDYSEESTNIIREIEEKVISDSLCIPCVSQKIIDFYKVRYEKSQAQFVLLENSRPFDCLTPIFSRSKESKLRVIVSVGDINKSRGFNELVKIWEILNPDGVVLDVRVKYITEDQKNEMIDIAQCTYGRSLNFIPPVSEDQMTESLLGYECGIIPYLPDSNLNNKYCCPNKFGQYMNAGLAVISSNTEYVTEKISRYDLGIIYNPTDIATSVKQFQDLIGSPEKLMTKRRNAYNFCKENYNWDRHIIPLLDKLKEFDSRIDVKSS